MMNPSTAPNYMQPYPNSGAPMQMQHGMPSMSQQQAMMEQGGGSAMPPVAGVTSSGGVVVTSFNGLSSTAGAPAAPSQMSMHTPNATVIPTAMSNGHMMTSVPPGTVPMHMARQGPPGAMYPANHPANIAMMKGQVATAGGAKYGNPMMQPMNGAPQNPGMMMTSGPMNAQQMAMLSNNNTVPYSPHGIYQQQFQMGPMGGPPQRAVPKHMMGSQIMMTPEMAAAAAAQQTRGMAPMNGPPPGSITRVAGPAPPPNGMNPNMYPPGQVPMNGPPQPQSMQAQQMYAGMTAGPNSSHSIPTQSQQQSLTMQQQSVPMAHSGPSNGAMNASLMNRQQQQKLIALQQQQQQFQQQQRNSQQQQMAMRQAITPPANLGSDANQAIMMNPNYQHSQAAMGMATNVASSSRLAMKDQPNPMNPSASSANMNGPMPSPVSGQQMTASMTMIGAPHSVPASHEVMPVSPQVHQPPQPGMHSMGAPGLNPLMSAGKRQTATPPNASPISNSTAANGGHPMNNPQVNTSRGTPSPIQQRKLSTSASLKRRSSSTSSFDCNNPSDPNKASNQPEDSIEPSKVCRLSESTATSTSGPGSLNPSFNPHTSNQRINSSSSGGNNVYSTLTISQLGDNGRKDSTCSSSNTDTHSSPDSGMGDSVGESNSVSSMNNNPQTPLSRLLNSTNNNNTPLANSRQLNTEEMLESLIQELGIEKLDHLPELIDIFDSDSVFSNNNTNTSNTSTSNVANVNNCSTTNPQNSTMTTSESKMKQSLISPAPRPTGNPIGQKC
ncbi:uncharacterized protein LOC142337224 [Convolutriloba macropyga]|uniref:uncharacterized protein LOC142337224 n=1 Tax=Convolutriloba macropyga TaxID=536237 RepID=UPI003F524E30